MTWLSAIFAAFLSVVLIAFGWMPCCCGEPCVTCSGLPATLHGILSVSGGNCGCANEINGLAITFTWNGTTSMWDSPAIGNCSTCGVASQTLHIQCGTSTTMTLGNSTSFACFGAQYGCVLNPPAITSTSVTCPPSFQAVFSGTFSSTGGAACPCAGRTWTLTVTL